MSKVLVITFITCFLFVNALNECFIGHTGKFWLKLNITSTELGQKTNDLEFKDFLSK